MVNGKKNRKRVSIVTPTYNRSRLLNDLYKSLVDQTNDDFKWIIIDDGSQDDTKEVVKSFINEGVLDITYLYQKNGGKHRALNRAIDICDTQLFFIVDSDDMLIPEAVEKVISIYASIFDKRQFCGLAGLRIDSNNKSKTNEMPKDIFDATALEATYKYKLFGDKAEVFFTNIIKNYRFPEFNGENYLTENVLWHKMAQDGYKMRWVNEGIYLCDYRNDGLTKHAFKNAALNCQGESYYHNQESEFDIPFKWKLKHQANYFRYGLFYTRNIFKLFIESRNKKLAAISFPIGILAAIYTKIKLEIKYA
ncbi:glycosyltransferase family A protein [uncultured Clostridium sp.]|uniref:glycosyltransferase family 2 protein n=1 Tax=uncultured Clostridium sp. TaxID=59620 RepID=UPI0025E9D114|nr:glycosyltransferase family A protein [uncultured Clostridium sp.]